MNLRPPIVRSWFVHVFVRGNYSGAYRFDKKREAMRDMRDRASRLRVLGCSYCVSRDEFICQTCDRGVGRGVVFCTSCRAMM